MWCWWFSNNVAGTPRRLHLGLLRNPAPASILRFLAPTTTRFFWFPLEENRGGPSNNGITRRRMGEDVVDSSRKTMAGYFFNKNRPSQYESDRDYLNRARDILGSVINKDMIEIPQSNGMRVLSQIPGLDFVGRYNLVLPGITQRFWEECIRRVTEPNFQYRICAMGIPGIGKTSSTPFLIRMLLRGKRTVDYRIASSDYFWEFS